MRRHSFLLITGISLLFVKIPNTVFAADNMCNVDRVCVTPQDWEKGWGDARKAENINKTPVRTETDTSGKEIRKAGESNSVNRSQKAADDAKARGGDPVNPTQVTISENPGKSGDVSTTSAPAVSPPSSKAANALTQGLCNKSLGLCQAFDPQTGVFTGYVPADKPVYATTEEAKLLRMNVIIGKAPYHTRTINGKTYNIYDLSGISLSEDIGQIGNLSPEDIVRIKAASDQQKAQTDSTGRVIIDDRHDIEEFNRKVNDFWQYQGQAQEALVNQIRSDLNRIASDCQSEQSPNVCDVRDLSTFVFNQTDAKLLSPDLKGQLDPVISELAQRNVNLTMALEADERNNSQEEPLAYQTRQEKVQAAAERLARLDLNSVGYRRLLTQLANELNGNELESAQKIANEIRNSLPANPINTPPEVETPRITRQDAEELSSIIYEESVHGLPREKIIDNVRARLNDSQQAYFNLNPEVIVDSVRHNIIVSINNTLETFTPQDIANLNSAFQQAADLAVDNMRQNSILEPPQDKVTEIRNGLTGPQRLVFDYYLPKYIEGTWEAVRSRETENKPPDIPSNGTPEIVQNPVQIFFESFVGRLSAWWKNVWQGPNVSRGFQ